MQFFKYEGYYPEEAEQRYSVREMRDLLKKQAMKLDAFLQPIRREAFLCVGNIDEDGVTVVALLRTGDDAQRLIGTFLETIEFPVEDGRLEEITLHVARGLLQNAARSGFIEDDEDILERFELHRLNARFGKSIQFSEKMIEPRTKDMLYRDAQRYLSNETLLPELDRIYAGKGDSSAIGHPVHYLLRTDSAATRRGLCELLTDALYTNKRLRSKRYCTISLKPDSDLYPPAYDALYKSCIGGALVVQFFGNEDPEGEFASENREMVTLLAKAMKHYRNEVLTIFCLERACNTSRAIFYENLGTVSVVELSEELVDASRATEHLKMLAAENNVAADDALLSKIEPDKRYLAPELIELFSEWYNTLLKTDVYPQYREIASAKVEAVKEAPKGSAYDELTEMIGLSEAKRIIKTAIDYRKAQKLFSEKGMKAEQPSMHMVFTGNPGTAKTTVARLFARIMRENDLLAKGHIIELGRGDLVGKYVGWTAPTVKKKFFEAKGGVLFIDEAYSLVDDRSGSFGDEAINTIVQEMENHRDELVVIFAGYPDKMEGFLGKNPGLRSRITFHVPFADYSTEELLEIAALTAKKKGLTLTDGARETLEAVFDAARTEPDFGNGRFVRNLVEKAKMAQAARLLSAGYDAVNESDVATITEADIAQIAPKPKAAPMRSRIGF